MNQICIIDYGLANIKSVYNAFSYFSGNVKIVKHPKDLKNAGLIVLPGVGSFDKGMIGIKQRGFDEAFNHFILDKKIPFLGICLGMQFLFNGSEEGKEEGLKLIDLKVRAFSRNSKFIKTPHIGWNSVSNLSQTNIFKDFKQSLDFYFVHSYYVPLDKKMDSFTKFYSKNGIDFIAGIKKDNIFATQFHPEKSQMVGMKLIEKIIDEI